jgi:hypothetical protein
VRRGSTFQTLSWRRLNPDTTTGRPEP